ncbi:hypothetical protein [Priestia taiwanensis]|nr:hypothetical protein [Priestia taiwanensis]MBM7361642.1 hypothetical protein [Priestia taiwanensis]
MNKHRILFFVFFTVSFVMCGGILYFMVTQFIPYDMVTSIISFVFIAIICVPLSSIISERVVDLLAHTKKRV